jgi:hypothetical protein
MDPATIAMLISSGMRVYADISERNASGTITDDDIAKMLALLGHDADTWQAELDAKKKI